MDRARLAVQSDSQSLVDGGLDGAVFGPQAGFGDGGHEGAVVDDLVGVGDGLGGIDAAGEKDQRHPVLEGIGDDVGGIGRTGP